MNAIDSMENFEKDPKKPYVNYAADNVHALWGILDDIRKCAKAGLEEKEIDGAIMYKIMQLSVAGDALIAVIHRNVETFCRKEVADVKLV